MIEEWLERLDMTVVTARLLEFFPRVVAATLLLVAVWIVLRVSRSALRAVLSRAHFDAALITFLVDDFWTITVWIFGGLMAVGQLGVNVGAALAGLGVAGIALGFAAQDSLSNTIAGFLIFWDRPFQSDDFISSQGHYGRVAEITMRTTRIRTQENTFVVIPNKKIIDDVLVNHSMYGETRVNVPVGIAYKESVAEARQVLLRALAQVDGLLDDPAPDVVLTELGDSSVNLKVRVWIRDASSERATHFAVVEACKRALDEAGIEIPFPHLQLFVDGVKDSVVEQLASVGSAADALPQSE